MDLPIGSIIMWNKSLAEIPTGWIICNGNDGTPNLQGKYVVGVSEDAGRGETGNATHSHTNSITVAGGNHVHDVGGLIEGTVSSVGVTTTSGGTQSGISPTHSHDVDMDLPASGTHQHTTSSTVAEDNDPLYLQLYFIMRKL